MFTRILSVSAFVATAAMASAHLPVPFLLGSTPQVAEPISGQIFIKVKPGKEQSVSSLTKKLKGKVVRSIPRIGWQLIKLPANVSYLQAEAQFRSNPNVLKTCPNYLPRLFATVNDPRFNEQYSMQRMQVPAAWDFSTGSPSVIVAVLDTGVDYNHPDLKNKVIKGKDYVDNDNDPMDAGQHGTHVAGIIAAETNNGVGIAGVGYNTKILAMRVIGQTYDVLATAVIDAADQGANIINMSLGSDGLKELPVMDDAIAYANDTKNVLVVCAAGNSGDVGNPVGYPAYNPRCIAVGASNEQDTRASFSQFNPADGSDNWVDVAAPGDLVLSTIPGGQYAEFSGTSMACPNVAGVASLIWSNLSEMGVTPTNTQVRQYIEENTDDVGNWVTFGRVNALQSLASIGIPVSDIPNPTVPAPFDGTVTYTPGSISASDGVSATIKSVRRAGVGLTGSFTTSFRMAGIFNDELRSAKLTLRATAEKLATLQVFVQDLSGNWKMLGSQPGNPAGKTTDYTLSKATLANYMTGNGDLRVMVRSFAPLRLATRVKGITQVDLLQVTYKGVRRPGATP
ncbi:peptidase S8 [bacterium]|nr:MAG: peptidase S8 [bacterium]